MDFNMDIFNKMVQHLTVPICMLKNKNLHSLLDKICTEQYNKLFKISFNQIHICLYHVFIKTTDFHRY